MSFVTEVIPGNDERECAKLGKAAIDGAGLVLAGRRGVELRMTVELVVDMEETEEDEEVEVMDWLDMWVEERRRERRRG